MDARHVAAKFCHRCGAAAEVDGNFCYQCGTSLSTKTVAVESRGHQMRAFGNATQSALSSDSANPPTNSFLGHPATFFICYVLALLPTYALPYFGSNSILANSVSAATDNGFTTAFWLHLTALYALVIVAWFRGMLVGRAWLPALSAIAGLFDLTPGLNWVPLVPTAFHVTTLILGVNREAQADRNIGSEKLIGAACGFLLLLFIGFYEPPEASFGTYETRKTGLIGLWALAETGCATGYGAAYTSGGRFVEGDEVNGVEGRWTIENSDLVREAHIQYMENEADWKAEPVLQKIQRVDRYPIIKITASELIFKDNRGKKFSYVKCHEGQRLFSDGEIAKPS